MRSEQDQHETPTGRAVCSFEELEHANLAREALVDRGFELDEISLLNDASEASEISAASDWFADTQDDVRRYRHEIEIGNTVLSAPATDEEQLQLLRSVFDENGGRMMTHFGDWVTTTEDLSGKQ